MKAEAIVYTSCTGNTRRHAPKQLPWLYRTMMAVKTKSVLKQPVKTEADRMPRDAFVNGGSWVTEEQLSPVLAWLEG